jgi:murein DD-endopeptidase MepM/ murein hydrolase activator NlpD
MRPIVLALMLGLALTGCGVPRDFEVKVAGGLNLASDYSSPFGPGGKPRGKHGAHDGLDFAAPAGTEVVSASFGKVLTIHNDRQAGLTILVEVPGTDYSVLYAHLSAAGLGVDEFLTKTADVRKFQEVKPGDRIGEIGDSRRLGRASTDHVHLSVRVSRGDRADHTNPHRFWYDGPGKVTCFEPDREYSNKNFGLVAPLRCGK